LKLAKKSIDEEQETISLSKMLERELMDCAESSVWHLKRDLFNKQVAIESTTRQLYCGKLAVTASNLLARLDEYRYTDALKSTLEALKSENERLSHEVNQRKKLEEIRLGAMRRDPELEELIEKYTDIRDTIQRIQPCSYLAKSEGGSGNTLN